MPGHGWTEPESAANVKSTSPEQNAFAFGLPRQSWVSRCRRRSTGKTLTKAPAMAAPSVLQHPQAGGKAAGRASMIGWNKVDKLFARLALNQEAASC
jgi:hypothetical protein